MRRFFRRLFTIVGAVVLSVSLIGYVIGFIKYERSLHLPEKIILTVDFDQPLEENPSPSPIQQLTGRPAGMGVTELVKVLDRARRDDRVAGLYATFGDENPSLVMVQELRAALDRFKQSGKFMTASAASFGEMSPADKAVGLASQFDDVWVQPGGVVGLTGIAIDMPFLRGLLDNYGVKPEVMTRKAFKTAMANATDKGFTGPHLQMMNQLLDALYAQLVEPIATGRKLSPDAVKALIDRGPLSAKEALDAKIVDHIGYPDEALASAKAKAGFPLFSPNVDAAAVPAAQPKKIKDNDDDRIVDWTQYAYVVSHRAPKGIPDAAPHDKSIAIIHVDGMIHAGISTPKPLGGGFESAGADTIADALDDARNDDDIKAVIVRIDSPGGSAVASETIRRAITRVVDGDGINQPKPVIVSMGTTAASGGYWIATGAKTIIADPATLTGSIGVLAGKFSVGDLLKRFDINDETLQRGANAGMWSLNQPFTAGQRDRINFLLDNVYDDFKARVMEARGIDAATAERVAQGRVWTGAEAKELKLVDELGGLDLAIQRAKEKIGIDNDTPAYVQNLPAQPSTGAQLRNLFKLLMSSGATIGKIDAALSPLLSRINAAAPAGPVQAQLPIF